MDNEFGCVIMASGLGKRFGGNKLMADFGGLPMIQCILNTTLGMFAKRVVVTRSSEVESLCRELWQQDVQGKFPQEVIYHELPGRNDTVRLGLGAMPETIAGCFFCPGDQPLLSLETMRGLIRCAAGESDKIWRPECGDRVGAPVYFPRELFDELRTLPEGKGGNYVVGRHPELVRMYEIANPLELADVDTPEDLARLLECRNAMAKS